MIVTRRPMYDSKKTYSEMSQDEATAKRSRKNVNTIDISTVVTQSWRAKIIVVRPPIPYHCPSTSQIHAKEPEPLVWYKGANGQMFLRQVNLDDAYSHSYL